MFCPDAKRLRRSQRVHRRRNRSMRLAHQSSLLTCRRNLMEVREHHSHSVTSWRLPFLHPNRAAPPKTILRNAGCETERVESSTENRVRWGMLTHPAIFVDSYPIEHSHVIMQRSARSGPFRSCSIADTRDPSHYLRVVVTVSQGSIQFRHNEPWWSLCDRGK